MTKRSAIRIVLGGQWSGGGGVVKSNLRFMADRHPTLFAASDRAAVGEPALLPRNLPDAASWRADPVIYMPQNAWAWQGPAGALAAKRAALRVASEAMIRRAPALVRLSTAVPARPGGGPELVLPNVLDEAFDGDLDAAMNSNVSLSGDTIYSPGSFVAYRNFETLIAGFRQADADARLVIEGPALDARYVRRILQMVGDDKRIDVRPTAVQRSVLLATAATSRLVVLPSRVEASAITALEVVAAGGRLLCSAVPGHLETLPEDLPCWRFAPRSVSSCAAGIEAALSAGRAVGRFGDSQQRATARAQWADVLAAFAANAIDLR